MNFKIITKDILKQIFKPRPEKSRKYDFGYLLVIGGSQLYSGSPALAAMAAMRTGLDLSLVIAPERAANIIASFSPNLIAYSLAGHDLESGHLPALLSLTESAKRVSNGKAAVVIGGGIGRDEETQKTVRDYLSKADIPVVIDADAIWAISKEKEILKGKKFILTPHSYEFYILSKISISELGEDQKIEIARDFAKEFETTIILKGSPDIISDGEEVFSNKTGCPEMTVGGTGDVLAGICGCFLAQGINPILAASASAYINGRAGELAKKEVGVGLLATDVIEYIPRVIKSELS